MILVLLNSGYLTELGDRGNKQYIANTNNICKQQHILIVSY